MKLADRTTLGNCACGKLLPVLSYYDVLHGNKMHFNNSCLTTPTTDDNGDPMLRSESKYVLRNQQIEMFLARLNCSVFPNELSLFGE